MNITSETFGGRNVVFDSILEDIPGGVSLDKTRVPSTLTYLKAGTLLNVNKSTRVAEFIKTAKCVADSADGDNVRVVKGHLFAAGDYVTDGYVVAEISSITTSEDDYDILVVGTTLVNYAAGVILVESASGKAVTKGATVTVTIATDKTITVTDPSGKAAGLIVSIASAADDNLAVSFSGKTLSIALANTTGTKNTPAVEIQAAVRALTSTLFDFSQFVLSGDEETTVTGTKTGTLALNSPYKYDPSGILKDTVNVEGSNAECSVVIRGAVRESALPYPVNNALKALLDITFNA